MGIYEVSLTLLPLTEYKYLRELLSRLLWRIPTNVDYLVELIKAVDGHGHVVIRGNNLVLSAR